MSSTKKSIFILKIFGWILAVLFSIVLLILIFIGPIIEYGIEKYDEEYTGRQIDIEDLNLNMFNGHLQISKLKLYEYKSDEVFFGLDTFDFKINVWKVIAGKYDIQRLVLQSPRVQIIQSEKGFNFDDLLKLAEDTTSTTPKDSIEVEETKESIYYWLRKLEISNAQVLYKDEVMGSTFVLNNLNFNADTISWDNPNHHYQLRTDIESGGKVNIDFKVDIVKYNYQLVFNVDSFNLHAIQNYLQPYLNIQNFEGILSTHVYTQGNFNTPDDLAGNSSFLLENFLLTDDRDRTFSSIKRFSFNIDTINTNNNKYSIDQIIIQEPYIRVEMFAKNTNIDQLMVEQTSPESNEKEVVVEPVESSTEQGPFEMLAEYMASFAKDFNENEFNISTAKIINGYIDYTDFTLADPFKVKLSNFNVKTGKISSSSPSVQLNTDAVMNDKGKLSADAKVSMNNYQNFSLNMLIETLPISSFNPYSTYFVAHPFWDGNIYFSSKNSVQNNKLKSDNILRVNEIEVGNKIKNKTATNVPVKLGVALLRDRNGNIEIEIPIEGNLADPNYKIGKAVIKIVTNILVKAVTAPYDLLANSFKCDPNDLKFIAYDYTQKSPNEKQIKNADLIAKVLNDKPGLNVEFTQAFNEEYEKNMLAVNAMKLQYKASKGDSIQIENIQATDSLFIVFINSKLKERDQSLSIFEKCRKIYGEKELEKACGILSIERTTLLKNYLINTKGVNMNRIRFNPDRKAEADAYDIGKFLINFYAD